MEPIKMFEPMSQLGIFSLKIQFHNVRELQPALISALIGHVEPGLYAYNSEISSQKGQALTRKRWLRAVAV